MTLRDAFPTAPGYLNAATMGLPPHASLAAIQADLARWAAGRATAGGYDDDVRRSRTAYARIVGVDVDRVAIGAQTSTLVGTVAASLPDGARVVTVADDFTSVTFPFLVHRDRGVTVRQVPLEALADAVDEGTDLVAFSLVQSADGRVADAAAVREAAGRAGAATLCDVTQAAGWYPVDAAAFDVTVCSAYKWLCCPRGTAFLTVSEQLQRRLRPVNAGWYAGETVWDSAYGPAMRLADSARRFDVSPAWVAWVGAAPALELLAEADLSEVHAEDVRLANEVREGLCLAPSDSAVVALDDADGALREALTAAGCVVAGRAGRVRFGFHVWNTEDDVERVLARLRGRARSVASAQTPTATRTA